MNRAQIWILCQIASAIAAAASAQAGWDVATLVFLAGVLVFGAIASAVAWKEL